MYCFYVCASFKDQLDCTETFSYLAIVFFFLKILHYWDFRCHHETTKVNAVLFASLPEAKSCLPQDESTDLAVDTSSNCWPALSLAAVATSERSAWPAAD